MSELREAADKMTPGGPHGLSEDELNLVKERMNKQFQLFINSNEELGMRQTLDREIQVYEVKNSNSKVMEGNPNETVHDPSEEIGNAPGAVHPAVNWGIGLQSPMQ